MASIQFRRRRRNLTAAALSGAAILLTVASVRAQDGGSFFEQLFGGGQRQAPAPQQSYDRGGPFDYGYARERRHARAVERRARIAREMRLKARYAALPKPDAVDPNRISGKQPVDNKAIADNPTKAILNDKTLRPGDIVILPSGPKVYTGGSEKRRRLSDFEDVRHSRFLGKKTRQQLVAMMLPVGAMPADQARKLVSLKLKLVPPEEIDTADAKVEAKSEHAGQPKGPRMIMPWKTQR